MPTATHNLHPPASSSGGHLHAYRSAFTLVEALLSCLMLVTIATIVSSIFFSALTTTDHTEEQMVIDSALRGKMEYLLGNRLADLASGTETVMVGDRSLTLTWVVTPVDMDGDGLTDTGAWQVTVSTATSGRSLTMLVVDTQGRVGIL